MPDGWRPDVTVSGRMHLADRLSGLLTAGLGLAVVLLARTFPAMPGQDIGPALFPSLVGTGLIAFGLWLVLADLRHAQAGWIRFDDWVHRAPMVRNLAVVLLTLVAYILLVEPLGFFLTGIALLSILMGVFGATRAWILPMAIVVTFAMHYGFYSLLRVPLPWGVFSGLAW